MRHAGQLPPERQGELLDFARSLPQHDRAEPFPPPRAYEQYPPGFGGMLARMLASRNLDWTSSTARPRPYGSADHTRQNPRKVLRQPRLDNRRSARQVSSNMLTVATSRDWLICASPDIVDTVARTRRVQADLSELDSGADHWDGVLVEYFEEARSLWLRYVPARGQADTVQGELVRAVEKLRDEAQRNANLNWSDGHAILARFIRDQLIGSGFFTGAAASEIEQDVGRLLDVEHPLTSDETYDRLSARIVEWSRAHPDPLTRVHDPALRI